MAVKLEHGVAQVLAHPPAVIVDVDGVPEQRLVELPEHATAVAPVHVLPQQGDVQRGRPVADDPPDAPWEDQRFGQAGPEHGWTRVRERGAQHGAVLRRARVADLELEVVAVDRALELLKALVRELAQVEVGEVLPEARWRHDRGGLANLLEHARQLGEPGVGAVDDHDLRAIDLTGAASAPACARRSARPTRG